MEKWPNTGGTVGVFLCDPSTMSQGMQKYGLNFGRRNKQIALRSYPLRLTNGETLQITVPRYVVKKLKLKAGDRLRFEPKDDKCLLHKETEKTPTADSSFPAQRAEPPKKDETSGPLFNHKKIRQGPISRKRRKRLLAEWQSNLTARALARQFGVTTTSIYNWARRYGLTYQPCSRGYKKEDLLAKWRSNLTSKELAKRLGMSLWKIYYWARKYGSTWDHWGMLSRRSYALQETGRRGYQVRIPRHVLNGLNLKTGDRLRFGVKNNRCTLSKEK